jgi:hypothetical protein
LASFNVSPPNTQVASLQVSKFADLQAFSIFQII